MHAIISAILLGAGLATALPFNAPMPRAATLDPAAVAEAQQRDDTATRAFSSVEIKTSTGDCLFVDPLSGDFRENLTPVQVAACDGSSGQQWDIITSGKHNYVPGFALVVSSLTNACLNFDPRRAAGNQVILFSCGGRADGGGTVTDSQLFSFSGGAGPLVLAPKNGNNGICMNVKGNTLDQTSCNLAIPEASEFFTFGSGSSSTSDVSSPAVVTSAIAASSTASQTTSATIISVSRAGVVLNPTAVAEAQQRDDTATRTFTAVPIKSADGQCLSVDATAGDFRENLIPVELKPCDGSEGQNFDVITQGKHNNVAGFALVVSSLTNGCLNFDPRRAAGDQVILFSCGGRADGEGTVTDSQLFAFGGVEGPTALVPKNGNNAVCLVGESGRLEAVSCVASQPSENELFTFGSSSSPTTPVSSVNAATTTAPAISTTVVVQGATTPASPTVISVSRAGVVLDPTAVAEAQQRDDTATRAFTAVPIKSANGQCFSIDPTAGDFRENLIPVELKDCDGSEGQNFDVITEGKHNNVPGFALIVSSLTNGCLNFDPRRAAGDQVILFSCGGRADGDGSVTDSQLFAFNGAQSPIALVPKNGNNAICLIPQGGTLDATACDTSQVTGDELFTFA